MSDRIWFSTTQAATYTGRHPKTVLSALHLAELIGSQKKAGCSWRIHRDALDAWMRGEAA